MARRDGSGGGMGLGGGMMAPVLSVATGLLIFVILVIFAPTIAGAIEDAQPSDMGGVCSYTNATSTYYGDCGELAAGNATHTYDTAFSGGALWDSDYNSDLVNGADVWTQNVQILAVIVLIVSIAIAMYYLKGMS